MIKGKKGQLEMMQTAFVLLILFVVFTLALIFYIGYQKTGIRQKQREIEGLEIIKRSQILNFLPELQCSFDGVVSSDCYDIEKFEAFQNYLQDAEIQFFYKTLLGDVRIILSIFEDRKTIRSQGIYWNLDYDKYSPGEEPLEHQVIDIIDDDERREDKDRRMIQFPVSVYDPSEDIYSLGIIYLEIYQ